MSKQAVKQMSIDLVIDGKKKTVKQNTLTVKALRKLLKFTQNINDKELQATPLEQIDMTIQILVDVFNNPLVTFEAIEESIPASELSDLVGQVMTHAFGVEEETDEKKA